MISRLLSATALASLTLVTAPAFAQAAPTATDPSQPITTAPASDQDKKAPLASADGEKRDDGEIVVTGSRIPRPETDGVLPGVQVSGQQIDSRGFTNALEALNELPLVGAGASPLNGNNGGQSASLGAAFVDLLDLGTARTLTLVNGRRFVSGNAASLFVSGNETGSQVDVNVIPSSLIQRVDVLTVGGAAAYGTDAIAGVVNYILKQDYDGVQLRALSGVSDRKDAASYQISGLVGHNFANGRGNITISGEYTRSDGLQADRRDFRLARPGSYTNPFNGGVRNPAFASAIIDVTNSNNGAFLRNSDDGQASNLFGQGLITNVLSYNGTVYNILGSAASLYPTNVPITQTVNGQLRTSNYITLQNGLAPVGFAIAARTAAGAATTIATQNNGFVSTTAQLIYGTPGAPGTAGYVSNNGLNGRTTAIGTVPFTTFAPTSLPAGVTAAQIFTAFGVTPPTGATAAQQSTLAINVLQNNRFTAREFYAANPTINPNYFVGTFSTFVPRVANTDTTLVTVRTNATGGTAQVPVNQVLPFVAVPLEFNPDGSLRQYTFTSGLTNTSPLTLSTTVGSNGGNAQGLGNTVLRTQQDRYVANLIGKFDITDQVTFFTENTYANVRNISQRNAASSNTITSTAENAPLLLNYNNPYLSAQDRTILTSVGITPTAANGGNFIVARQNQDIFGDNPYTNTSKTFRLVGGLRSKFDLFGKNWNAEISGTFGKAIQQTKTTQIKDIEYQLALDAVLDPTTNTIRCRAQLFPSQYLGRTPIGVTPNVSRLPGADGIATEQIVTPTITQAQIDGCQPLNPFGYNNMSNAAKQYVRQDVLFRNVSKQTFLQATLAGSLIDLPAGPLGVSAAAEYRKDEIAFTSDIVNRLGGGRAAPSANTFAQTETYEIGGEARIPLTSRDFLSFMGELELDPAVRVTQQSGSAATYRNIGGQLVTPKSNGDPATIYSLAGRWAPIRDIQFRGNYTRSVRQPSIVELFLGGQAVFTAPTDYCSPANIDQGVQKANRRANCRAAVIASGAGGATTADAADTFLSTFAPQGISLSGTYSGTQGLKPERGKSWTAGGVLTPRFIPGLSISADYIDLTLDDVIVPTGLGQAIQTCYDSPTYPDSTAQIGTNTCNFFARDSNFQIANGFALGFLNLGATKIHALNIAGRYPIQLGSLGLLTVQGSAYHLITYQDSSAGDFSDTLESAGTFSRPKWKTNVTGRYEHGGFYTQLTWNWQNKTRLFSSGLPATAEFASLLRYPAVSRFDITVGADVNEKFRIQLNVQNLTDKIFPGDESGLGYFNQAYIDQIGRRFQVAVTTKF